MPDSVSSRRRKLPWLLLTLLSVGGSAVLLVPRLIRQTVDVTHPMRGPVVQAFYATGMVAPSREHPLRTSVAGTLRSVLVDRGDAVQRDQLLVEVDAPELQYALDRAEAELREKRQRRDEKSSPVLMEFDARISAATALLELARREQERLSGLVSGGGASTVDVDRASDRVKTLWSELESLKAQRVAKVLELQRDLEVAESAFATARWNLEQTKLRSPVDGVVLDRPTSLGTRVAVNDTIMRIADVRPQSLVMRAAVDEEDIAQVNVGQLVRMTLYAFPGRTFDGKVLRIYDEADSSRRTFEVEVGIDEPDPRLLPGMTGELAFIIAEKLDATIIPAQSAYENAVYVVRDGRVKRLPATFGLRSVDRVEVLSELSLQELVVTGVVGAGTEGARVNTRFADPKQANGLVGAASSGGSTQPVTDSR